MKNLIFTLLILLGSGFALAGCQNVNKEAVGAVGGGVAGGYAGSALSGGSALGTIGGTLGGAYLGSQVAKNINNP